MKVKRMHIIWAVCMAAILLAGCGTSGADNKAGDSAAEETKTSPGKGEIQADNGKKITLKLFHNWINMDEAPYFDDIAAEFEAGHPNVDIVVEYEGRRTD